MFRMEVGVELIERRGAPAVVGQSDGDVDTVVLTEVPHLDERFEYGDASITLAI